MSYDELEALQQEALNTPNYAPNPNTPQAPASRTSFLGLSLGSWVLVLGFVAFVGVLGLQLSRQNRLQPQAGEPAPRFSAPDVLTGELRSLDALRAGEPPRIVVLNFWGSWCPPCRAEAPDFQALYEDYQAQGVLFVGVNHLDTERAARAFIAEFGISYPNVFDLENQVSRLYAIQGAPETYLIGRDGIIFESFLGAVDYQRVARALDAYLAKPTPAQGANS